VEADGSRVTWLYDNTYQLTGEHRSGTTPYRNTFTYDSRGNRTLKNEGGTRTTYAYDAANQLQTAKTSGGTTTYTFDANGNQQLVQAPSGDRTTNTWDYENRTTLVQLPSGIRNTMAYEPGGLRVKLEESTGTKKFVWDNRQAYLAETDANDGTVVVYTQEPRLYGNLISQRRSSTTSWYHYEALGSTRQLTDATEASTDQYLYDAWGNIVSSFGTMANPFRYVGMLGYYFDDDTSNSYVRARVFQPSTGRWLSHDPYGLAVSLNMYAMLLNPIRYRDPSGGIPDKIFDQLVDFFLGISPDRLGGEMGQDNFGTTPGEPTNRECAMGLLSRLHGDGTVAGGTQLAKDVMWKLVGLLAGHPDLVEYKDYVDDFKKLVDLLNDPQKVGFDELLDQLAEETGIDKGQLKEVIKDLDQALKGNCRITTRDWKDKLKGKSESGTCTFLTCVEGHPSRFLGNFVLDRWTIEATCEYSCDAGPCCCGSEFAFHFEVAGSGDDFRDRNKIPFPGAIIIPGTGTLNILRKIMRK
ncbi:MAG: hypothetical protein KDA66_10645, partial [Planctomycetaceae bacterium]|nr:hypothetical protein [Planctomycetaceae bacterium]